MAGSSSVKDMIPCDFNCESLKSFTENFERHCSWSTNNVVPETMIESQVSRFGAIGENRPLPSVSGRSPSQNKIETTRYICNICKTPGHYIKDCPQARPKSLCLTPYQGEKRCVGTFHCASCSRQWISRSSWANCYQRCKGCLKNVYPHLQKQEEAEPNNAHLEQLCLKCITLGYNCQLRDRTCRGF